MHLAGMTGELKYADTGKDNGRVYPWPVHVTQALLEQNRFRVVGLFKMTPIRRVKYFGSGER